MSYEGIPLPLSMGSPLYTVEKDGTKGVIQQKTPVWSQQNTYTVSADQEVCTCPDHQQNHRICKHIRRSRFALGIDELSAAMLRELDIADNFAAHCPGPIVLASDGGLIGDSKTQVESSKEITGHDQPQRSEKADFGGGESTGIQEL